MTELLSHQVSDEDEELRTERKTIEELKTKIDDLKKEIQNLKEENESYRKEKTENEKILIEQMEALRNESKDLMRANVKLASQIEQNEDKFKIFANNIEIYKTQINALEKKTNIYSETIVKHEQTITYLKDEAMQAQTRLSKAEVMLANLEKENALLKDSESRLLRERELLKRESHSQSLIRTNIELIKVKMCCCFFFCMQNLVGFYFFIYFYVGILLLHFEPKITKIARIVTEIHAILYLLKH